MPQGRDNFSLFNQNDVQGLVTEHVAKGLTIVPYLDKATTTKDNWVVYNEEMTPEAAIAAGVQDLPEKRAPGSKLRVIRTTGISGKAQPILMTGFKYVVETDRIENQPYSVDRDVRRLAYSIGRTVDRDAITRLGAKAAADAASLNDGVWSASTGVDKDVMAMQAAFYDDSLPDELSGLFYEAVNFNELRTFRRAQEGAGEGFNNMNEMDWLGTKHIYGGSGMTHGTALGFDLNNPPAVVAYRTLRGAFTPSVLNGMEGYAPVINCKIKQIDDEIPDTTEIYMAAQYTIAVEEPAALLKQTGL